MKSISGRVCSLLFIIVFAFNSGLFAQNSNYKLEFKNGTSIIGQIIKQTDDSLIIKTTEGNVYKYVMTDLKVVSPTGYSEPKVNTQVQPLVEPKKEKNNFPISVGLDVNYNNTVLTQTKYSPLILPNRNLNFTVDKFKNNNFGIQFKFAKGLSNKLDFNVGLTYTKYLIQTDSYYWYYFQSGGSFSYYLKYISLPINLSFYNKQKASGFYFDFGINPQLFFQIIDVNSKESITKQIGFNREQYRVISFNSLLGLGYYFKLNNDLKIKAGLNYTAELLEFNIGYFKNSLSTVSNKHNIYPTIGINYTINKK